MVANSVAGGGSGIRTHDTVSRIHAFQACALSHSAIPPGMLRRAQYSRRGSGDKAMSGAAHVPHSTASIHPPHLAGLAQVVAAELRRALVECCRSHEPE